MRRGAVRHGEVWLCDVVDVLAVYRIVRLIIDDEIFDTPREHVMESLRRAGYDKAITGLQCYWCTGMYVAFAVVAARAVVPRVWGPVARALAFSAAAGIVDHQLA